jgi:triacylglycerol lipase
MAPRGAFAGDFIMHDNRRQQCEAWSETSTPASYYRFNTHSADKAAIHGATHMAEIAFVFNNIAGLGYHSGKPFEGAPQSYIDLSSMMASMWTSFIHDLDPDADVASNNNNMSVHLAAYEKDAPANIFLDANTTGTRIEPDT